MKNHLSKIKTARFIQAAVLLPVLYWLVIGGTDFELRYVFPAAIIFISAHFYAYANMYCLFCGERFSLYNRYFMPPDICPHCKENLK